MSTTSDDVFQAVQASPDPDANFGAFQPVVQASTHAMTGIDCGYLADGTLTVMGLSSGAVWSLSSAAPSSLDWILSTIALTDPPQISRSELDRPGRRASRSIYMMRVQRVTLGLLCAAIALQSGCRDLDGEPIGDIGASGGAKGETAGAGSEASFAGENDTGGQASGAAGQPVVSAGGSGGQGSDFAAEAGHAGSEDESAGSAGRADGDLLPDIQDVPEPGCISGFEPGQNIPLVAASSLTATLLPNGLPYLLYVADAQGNRVTVRWRTATEDDKPWSNWLCLDTVVRPEHVSAITIEDRPTPDNTPEVYATNAAGKLFVRRFYMAIWATWESLGLPRATSHVIDVAASSTPATLPFVYVIDSGRIFTRRHSAAQAYSSYTPWREIRDVPAQPVHLCAGVQSDRRQQLFVSTANGDVFQAIQASPDPDANFGTFQPVVQASTHAMTDIDCGYLADGTVTVIGLSSGTVWSHSSATPSSLDWTQESSNQSFPLTVFALASSKNRTPTVFGIDAHNVAWWHLLGASSWTPF